MCLVTMHNYGSFSSRVLFFRAISHHPAATSLTHFNLVEIKSVRGDLHIQLFRIHGTHYHNPGLIAVCCYFLQLRDPIPLALFVS